MKHGAFAGGNIRARLGLSVGTRVDACALGVWRAPAAQTGRVSAHPGTASATTTVGSCIGAGHTLAAGQQLVSPNGQYRTVMQGDGNLVLYTASGPPLWDSRTGGNPGARTVLQGTDGPLVAYGSNNPCLSSAYTNPRAAA